jgi:surface protein
MTDSVESMDQMFHSCKKLTSIDLSGFDTNEVTRMNDMFGLCSGLTYLD